jgi:CPA2 family monovalent cation:H+ antiporter-2
MRWVFSGEAVTQESPGFGSVVVRSLAVTTGLVLSGNPQRESLRAGLMAIPIGEFAFIIAQVGVSSGLLAPDFYPIAIGVATLAVGYFVRAR